MDVYLKISTVKAQGYSGTGSQFFLNDYISDYVELLDEANVIVPGMKIMVLRYLAIKVNKCINSINCINPYTSIIFLLPRNVNTNYVMFPSQTGL